MSAAETPISIDGLTKVYRTRRGDVVALDNVSLTVDAGEIVVLLGPSGCGKTTLLRCVAGLERPDAGEISIGGHLAFSATRNYWLPPERRHLSMVFQSYALWPHMTVFDNVAYPLQNLKVGGAETRERTNAVLRVVGLDGHADRYPGQLSGGQQQRVALARAIVSNEGVVLFDEPLSNLDAKVRERLRIEILALQRDIRFTALYVTHDQAEASALADRVVVMADGAVAQVGSSSEIYHHPRSRYVAGFVGSANEFDGVVTQQEGEYWRVDTALGPIVGRAVASELQPGSRAILMFRPEHCQLDPVGPGANRLSCQLVRSVFFGSYVDHVLAAGSQNVVARGLETLAPPHEGSTVTLGIDSDRVWLFPDN